MSVVSLWHILYDCHACNGVEVVTWLKNTELIVKKKVIVDTLCTVCTQIHENLVRAVRGEKNLWSEKWKLN